MKSIYLQVLIWLFCVQGYSGNKSCKVIWAIEKADKSAAEFALFPNGFKKFIENNFGYEDKFYLIRHSNEKKISHMYYLALLIHGVEYGQLQTCVLIR